MISNPADNTNFSRTSRDPNLAACLSIAPGLGQLYNGQTRKGLLFLAVSVFNFFIFLLITTNLYIVTGLNGFGQAFHMKPNRDLILALGELRLGTTVSVIIIGLLLAFIVFCIRDAYDNAVFQQRKEIYADYAMDMPEATSSSYLLHFSFLILFFILAIFFLKQHRPAPQITDIEFVTNQPITQKKIVSEKKAEHNSEAAGKHENKPVVAPSPAPKSPSKPAPKAAPQKPQPVAKPTPTPKPQPVAKPMPVARPVPAPTPHPVAKPVPVPIPHPTVSPSPMPMPTNRPMPAPSPIARPSASPNPSPSPMPAPSASHRGIGGPAPAPKLGTGPIVTGAPGPAPIAVTPGNGGGSPSPTPMPVSGGGSTKGNSGNPAPAPAPTRGGGRTGGSSGPALMVAPSLPRAPGGSSGEGIRGNPDPNNSSGKAPSVAAQADVDFGPYMADLQRRIKRAWFPPKGNESKRVVVIFKVHKGGELSNLRLDHSSGVASADQAALKAVENAAPFRPLPAGAADDVDIQFTFDYNVFSGGGTGIFRRF